VASQNIVSVCNISLLSIGAQAQISNLTENSTQANACNTLYQFVYEQLARTALWNCLRQQAVLTLIQAAQGTPENPTGSLFPQPPIPWLYAYSLPSNCLQARYIVPSFPSTGNSPISPAYVAAAAWLPGAGQIPFQVAYGTDSLNNPIQIILTNQTQAQLVYTVNQPNPQIWDADFTAAYVASMAAYLVPALSLNMALMQIQVKLAEGIIANARVRDGNEGSTQQDHIPDFMRARNSGGGYGYNILGGYGMEGWSNMAWPC
jgi:hypothetical protein